MNFVSYEPKCGRFKNRKYRIKNLKSGCDIIINYNILKSIDIVVKYMNSFCKIATYKNITYRYEKNTFLYTDYFGVYFIECAEN